MTIIQTIRPVASQPSDYGPARWHQRRSTSIYIGGAPALWVEHGHHRPGVTEPTQREERGKGRSQQRSAAPREPVRDAVPRFDGPPPPEFVPTWVDSDVFTGAASFDKPVNNAPKSVAFKAPGYIAQLFEILLHYPALVVELHARDGHKLLTNAGLAGFVLSLYREVSANGHQMSTDFVELGQPEVVTFLRVPDPHNPD